MLLSPRVAEELSSGAVLLTPNQRTARFLASEYDREQRAGGALAWQPARILPWRAWTADLWSELLMSGVDDRPLLSSEQESALWEQVYEAGALQTLRSGRSIAEMCREAYALLGAYDAAQAYARVPVSALSTDCAAYHAWHLRFVRRCRDEALLPSADLDRALSEHVRHGSIHALPRQVLLYGINELTPAQSRLLSVLGESGVSHTHVPAPAMDSRTTLLPAADAHEEFSRCAAWARSRLEQNSAASILIIVPDLDACRPTLERALRKSLAPEQNNLLADLRPLPYDFSIGRPLASVPLAADALRILRWAAGALPIDDISALLISPYCTFAPTQERGAEMDAHTRRRRRSHPTPAMRADALASSVAKGYPEIAAELHKFQQRSRSAVRGRTTYAEWADAARLLLREAGWPGTRERASTEFQAVERFEEVLDSLSSLDLLLPRCSWTEYLPLLSQAAARTQFAPENTGAPVQVVTLSEARGLQADAAWFLHASETAWSARRSTHPFLPRSLQERCGMPGANEQADDDASRREALRIAGCAPEVCFSYATQTPDGVQRPSPLLQAVPQLVSAAYDSVNAEQALDSVSLEELADEEPLPMLPDAVPSHGGSGVLVSQAACPFRAFAEFRLFSSIAEDVEEGLSSQDRGSILHDVLHLFWKEVRTKNELLRRSREMDPSGRTKRDETLARCIEQALPSSASGSSWENTYFQIQRARMQTLLGRWLDLEAARPDFQVLALEQDRFSRIGDLTLKIRIDRVDEVTFAGGKGAVLLDYKTGRCSVNGWKGERPDAPQLPLYALAGGLDEVSGVAFAAIAPGKKGMEIRGVSTGPGILPDKPKHEHNLLERLQGWKDTLVDLADGFASGDARVDPKEFPGSCKFCGQRLLCRVNPSLADMLDAEEEAEA